MIITEICSDPGSLVLLEEALPHTATVPNPAQDSGTSELHASCGAYHKILFLAA
jgi:hypothetical protein